MHLYLSTTRKKKVLTFLSFTQFVFFFSIKQVFCGRASPFHFFILIPIQEDVSFPQHPPPPDSVKLKPVPCFPFRLIIIVEGGDILLFANEAVIFFLFFGVSARIGGV